MRHISYRELQFTALQRTNNFPEPTCLSTSLQRSGMGQRPYKEGSYFYKTFLRCCKRDYQFPFSGIDGLSKELPICQNGSKPYILNLAISFEGHKMAWICLRNGFRLFRGYHLSICMILWEACYLILPLECIMKYYFTRWTRFTSHLLSTVTHYTHVRSPRRAERSVTRPSLKSV